MFKVTLHFEGKSVEIGSSRYKSSAELLMWQNAQAWYGVYPVDLRLDGNVYAVYVHGELNTHEWYTIEEV